MPRVLIGILALALMLRLWGLGYGLPAFLIGDEPALVGGALKMAQLRTVIPALAPEAFQILYYPPLLPYVYLVLFLPTLGLQYVLLGIPGVEEFERYLVFHPEVPWLIARGLSAFMGTATVYILYRLGSESFRSQSAGLVAAALLAVDFLHVQQSHYARIWVPTVFLLYATIWAAWRIYECPTSRGYLLAGGLAGLGFGISYMGAFGLLAALAVHLWTRRRLLAPYFLQMIGIFLLLAVAFTLLHPQAVYDETLGERSSWKQSKSLGGWLASWGYYADVLWKSDPFLLLVGCLGFLSTVRRRPGLAATSLAIAVCYVSIMYLDFHHEARYILPMLPGLALFGGGIVAEIGQRLRRRVWWKALLAGFILALGYSTAIAFRYDLLLARPDTRLLAKRWIEVNVPAGTKIAVGLKGVKLTPTKAALREQQALDPTSLRYDDRTLLALLKDRYPAPAFHALHLRQISSEALAAREFWEYLQEAGYVYYVLDYWTPGEISGLEWRVQEWGELFHAFAPGPGLHLSLDPNGAHLRDSVNRLFKMERLGPVVGIYRLPWPR